MSWIKTQFRNWIIEAEQNECMSTDVAYSKTSAFISNRLDAPGGINFRVCKATGGYVVETSSYDIKTDRSKSNLYIITDDQDMGQEIGKILTMEALRHG